MRRGPRLRTLSAVTSRTVPGTFDDLLRRSPVPSGLLALCQSEAYLSAAPCRMLRPGSETRPGPPAVGGQALRARRRRRRDCPSASGSSASRARCTRGRGGFLALRPRRPPRTPRGDRYGPASLNPPRDVGRRRSRPPQSRGRRQGQSAPPTQGGSICASLLSTMTVSGAECLALPEAAIPA